MTARLARVSRFLIPVFALTLWVGCAGVQKSIDTALIKGTVGKKYSETLNPKGFKIRTDYGKELATETLSDGSTFHLHVHEYESGSSSWGGVWGRQSYSYKLNGFKVKDDVITDWAYGLYTPPEKAKVLFSSFEFGFNHKAMFERIKKEYPDLVKTSTDGSYVAWRK